MSILEPLPMHTYRIRKDDVEDHFNVARVHGRRIEFKVTAWSALYWNTTRLRWRKAVQGALDAGCTVTEEPWDGKLIAPAAQDRGAG